MYFPMKSLNSTSVVQDDVKNKSIDTKLFIIIQMTAEIDMLKFINLVDLGISSLQAVSIILCI